MQIAEQLAVYLHNNNAGVFSKHDDSGNIYIDFAPSKQNSMGILNRSGISGDIRNNYRMVGIQIYFRGSTNPVDSYERAENVFVLLNGFKGHLISNYVVDCISYQGGPDCLGRGENNWFEYTMNFIVHYKE